MAGIPPGPTDIACRGIAAAHEADAIRRRRERKADRRPRQRRLQGKAMHGKKREGEPHASQSVEQSPAHIGKRHRASLVVNASRPDRIGRIAGHQRNGTGADL
jgi:hypothetical protein